MVSGAEIKPFELDATQIAERKGLRIHPNSGSFSSKKSVFPAGPSFPIVNGSTPLRVIPPGGSIEKSHRESRGRPGTASRRVDAGSMRKQVQDRAGMTITAEVL